MKIGIENLVNINSNEITDNFVFYIERDYRYYRCVFDLKEFNSRLDKEFFRNEIKQLSKDKKLFASKENFGKSVDNNATCFDDENIQFDKKQKR